MPSSVFDSAYAKDLFSDAEVAQLLSDQSAIRAMLLVWGALALAQAEHGVIPKDAAEAIQHAAETAAIDPETLASDTGRNGVVVPALVAAFRAQIAPVEHRSFVHWGATSQDIIDTSLTLRLRRMFDLFDARLDHLLYALAEQAETHAHLPMAARTYGQAATPTTFGAVAAQWGRPLLDLKAALGDLRPECLVVSLSGAAGTLSAMDPFGPAVRHSMSKRLKLGDPAHSWHAARDPMGALAAWLTRTSGALGKLGEDVTLGCQSGIEELTLPSTGASSTMPQKQNPVGPALLGALARYQIGLNSVMQGAALGHQQRDGAAWFSEWLALPQMLMTLGRGLTVAIETVTGLEPRADRMSENLEQGGGLIYAEALSFALAAFMPRPAAQKEVKALTQTARETGRTLADLAAEKWPDKDLAQALDPIATGGTATADALSFARDVKGM
ncbi:MAG: lyase family protein [Pseudomonadota bacterium]